MEPSENPDSGRAEFAATPFGNDKNVTSHVQPVSLADANKTLPGEQEDPRLC